MAPPAAKKTNHLRGHMLSIMVDVGPQTEAWGENLIGIIVDLMRIIIVLTEIMVGLMGNIKAESLQLRPEISFILKVCFMI